MLNLPFYQTHWNSIDLVSLAQELNLPSNSLPTAEFYDAFYSKLNAKPELVSDKWKDGKQGQSVWLKEQLTTYAPSNAKIISIGSGFGLIEKPLIEEGMRIELQDFQSSSFEHLGLDQLTTCHAGHWDKLPDQEFDVCFSMATSYAFDDQTFHDFTKMVERILKPGGVCLLMDTSISWWEIYAHIRNYKRYQREQILWGYKRSLPSWKKYFRNFEVINQQYYAQGMKEISVKTLMGIPFNATPYRQLMVVKKESSK